MSVVQPRREKRRIQCLYFFHKMRAMGLDEYDESSKSIKQLSLLFLMLGLDRKIIKDATTKLMNIIICGENSGCAFRQRKC